MVKFGKCWVPLVLCRALWRGKYVNLVLRGLFQTSLDLHLELFSLQGTPQIWEPHVKLMVVKTIYPINITGRLDVLGGLFISWFNQPFWPWLVQTNCVTLIPHSLPWHTPDTGTQKQKLRYFFPSKKLCGQNHCGNHSNVTNAKGMMVWVGICIMG